MDGPRYITGLPKEETTPAWQTCSPLRVPTRSTLLLGGTEPPGIAERDSGRREGPTTGERERIKELERENRELKRANEILGKAPARPMLRVGAWRRRSSIADGSDGAVHRRSPERPRGRSRCSRRSRDCEERRDHKGGRPASSNPELRQDVFIFRSRRKDGSLASEHRRCGSDQAHVRRHGGESRHSGAERSGGVPRCHGSSAS